MHLERWIHSVHSRGVDTQCEFHKEFRGVDEQCAFGVMDTQCAFRVCGWIVYCVSTATLCIIPLNSF